MKNKTKKLALLSLLLGLTTSSQSARLTQNLAIEQAQSGELWVEVKAQDLKGKMILDTGSTGSVLDTRQLAAIGEYQQLAKQKGFGVGSKDVSLESEKIKVSNFEVSGYVLENVPLNVHSLSHLEPSFIGIVGFDVIKRLSQGMEFTQNGTQMLAKSPIAQGKNVLELHHSEFGLPYVTMELNDFEVGFILDTGSQHSLVNVSQTEEYFIQTTKLEGAYGYDLRGNKIQLQMTEALALKNQDELLFESKLLAVDLSSVLTNDSFDHHVIGIIGLKTLMELNTVINFASETVNFRG